MNWFLPQNWINLISGEFWKPPPCEAPNKSFNTDTVYHCPPVDICITAGEWEPIWTWVSSREVQKQNWRFCSILIMYHQTNSEIHTRCHIVISNDLYKTSIWWPWRPTDQCELKEPNCSPAIKMLEVWTRRGFSNISQSNLAAASELSGLRQGSFQTIIYIAATQNWIEVKISNLTFFLNKLM